MTTSLWGGSFLKSFALTCLQNSSADPPRTWSRRRVMVAAMGWGTMVTHHCELHAILQPIESTRRALRKLSTVGYVRRGYARARRSLDVARSNSFGSENVSSLAR